MPVVKVQLPLASSDATTLALVYAEGRRRMRHTPLSSETLAALGDDPKGYFAAEWKDDDWVIGARVTDQDW
jgi:hypothetical protein